MKWLVIGVVGVSEAKRCARKHSTPTRVNNVRVGHMIVIPVRPNAVISVADATVELRMLSSVLKAS